MIGLSVLSELVMCCDGDSDRGDCEGSAERGRGVNVTRKSSWHDITS